jgi:3-phenylpropionate/cinnamic acid dioxygenase small subunit
MEEAHEMMKQATLTRAEAEDFLYAEARLIDEDQLEQWLQLFTPDGIYWLPSDENADPEYETSIIHDDKLQLEKRIYQLRNKHLAQDPRSRTVHFISNVQVEAGNNMDEVTILCNQIIHELRPGDHQRLQAGLGQTRSFATRCKYTLQHQNGSWHIALKQVLLIDRDLPLENISFIL